MGTRGRQLWHLCFYHVKSRIADFELYSYFQKCAVSNHCALLQRKAALLMQLMETLSKFFVTIKVNLVIVCFNIRATLATLLLVSYYLFKYLFKLAVKFGFHCFSFGKKCKYSICRLAQHSQRMVSKPVF